MAAAVGGGCGGLFVEASSMVANRVANGFFSKMVTVATSAIGDALRDHVSMSDHARTGHDKPPQKKINYLDGRNRQSEGRMIIQRGKLYILMYSGHFLEN